MPYKIPTLRKIVAGFYSNYANSSQIVPKIVPKPEIYVTQIVADFYCNYWYGAIDNTDYTKLIE